MSPHQHERPASMEGVHPRVPALLTTELRQSLFKRPQKGEGFRHQRIVVLPRAIVGTARAHVLLSGLLTTDIGFFPSAEGHLRERPNGVDQTIFIYCSSGGGWCEVRGQRHHVTSCDLLVVPAGEPHIYGADERRPWTISWFHAIGDHVSSLIAMLGVSAEKPVVSLSDDSRWPALFEDALSALEQGYTTTNLVHASHTVRYLLSTTLRSFRSCNQGSPDTRTKILQCVEFMKQHLDQPLTLPQLAAIANMSPSHFKMLFKQHVGYACIDYFIRLRIHYASQLLDTTDLSAKHIAALVGYEDPLWFSKAFRAITGMPPSEFRRKHKG